MAFTCENNLYGEYGRIDRTTSVAHVEVRAYSYCMPQPSSTARMSTR